MVDNLLKRKKEERRKVGSAVSITRAAFREIGKSSNKSGTDADREQVHSGDIFGLYELLPFPHCMAHLSKAEQRIADNIVLNERQQWPAHRRRNLFRKMFYFRYRQQRPPSLKIVLPKSAVIFFQRNKSDVESKIDRSCEHADYSDGFIDRT